MAVLLRFKCQKVVGNMNHGMNYGMNVVNALHEELEGVIKDVV